MDYEGLKFPSLQDVLGESVNDNVKKHCPEAVRIIDYRVGRYNTLLEEYYRVKGRYKDRIFTDSPEDQNTLNNHGSLLKYIDDAMRDTSSSLSEFASGFSEGVHPKYVRNLLRRFVTMLSEARFRFNYSDEVGEVVNE